MVSTFTNFKLIARDIDRSLATVSKQPMVARETAYFQENIGKVKTAEEFVNDSRLFNYAMKAHGLADMAYAKAFMLKALNEGVKESDAFANKLTDKRYAEFVKVFNFAARGAEAAGFVQAKDEVVARYQIEAINNGVDPLNTTLQAQVKYYNENIGKVKSVDDLMADSNLYALALKAYGLEDRQDDTVFMRQLLTEGVSDPDSLANRQKDPKYAEFASVFDFAAKGAGTTSYRPAVEGTVASFMRQTLEENAGQQNDGVRLALYFQRKAPTLTNVYQILSDKALGEVVRTALGLPDAFATADVDRQVAAITKRIDVADFKDPEKLEKFLSRFTTMHEMKTGMSSTPNVALLLQPSRGFGLSTDLLVTLQNLRR